MLPLRRSGGDGWTIEVTNQANGVNPAPLKTALVSFADFADLGGRPRFDIDRDRLAGELEITGGTFDFDLSTSANPVWKVSKRLQGNAVPHAKNQLAWNVKWRPGGDLNSPTTIRARRGGSEETLEIPAGSEPTIIIGNLDVANAASWPLREVLTVKQCEGVTGTTRTPDTQDCYDNDFKWFYRLLVDSNPNGVTPLPAPYAENVTLGPKLNTGYDTPTCFPGGD
jgi:hypothetical protein